MISHDLTVKSLYNMTYFTFCDKVLWQQNVFVEVSHYNIKLKYIVIKRLF